MLNGEVIHITSDEHSRNWKYDQNHKKVSNRIQIVSIDDIPSIRSLNIQLPSHLYEGDILVRHPYEKNTYIHASNAAFEIRFSKYCKIREIAQKLGAEGCIIEEAIEDIEERSLTINGDVSYNMIKSSLNIKEKDALKKAMGINIKNKFDGKRIISAESYAGAIELAKEYDLWNDSMIKSLIGMRNPNQENQLIEDSLRFNMTKEANSLLDAAFSLNVLNGIFNLDIALNRELLQRETIILDINFVFPGDNM